MDALTEVNINNRRPPNSYGACVRPAGYFTVVPGQYQHKQYNHKFARRKYLAAKVPDISTVPIAGEETVYIVRCT